MIKIKADKVYLINLERRPDRLDHFLNECKRENVDMSNVHIFKAYDAKSYKIKDEELKMFNSVDFDLKTSYSKPCICNQLSHYNILKDIVKKKYKKCIIFQDDVRLRKNFVEDVNKVLDNMPDDTEIIWIGLHKVAAGSYFKDFDLDDTANKYYVKDKINEYVCRYKDEINPCSLAYIVTYEGARRYIDQINKIGFLYATDINFNGYLLSKGVMYGSYDVLCTGNSKFKSDVFESDNNAIERDMMELLGI
jgi:GR25 family glycosyltransferase involved in LPS biosynthesis